VLVEALHFARIALLHPSLQRGVVFLRKQIAKRSRIHLVCHLDAVQLIVQLLLR
jgi:hypothetical protein